MTLCCRWGVKLQEFKDLTFYVFIVSSSSILVLFFPFSSIQNVALTVVSDCLSNNNKNNYHWRVQTSRIFFYCFNPFIVSEKTHKKAWVISIFLRQKRRTKRPINKWSVSFCVRKDEQKRRLNKWSASFCVRKDAQKRRLNKWSVSFPPIQRMHIDGYFLGPHRLILIQWQVGVEESPPTSHRPSKPYRTLVWGLQAPLPPPHPPAPYPSSHPPRGKTGK